MVSNFTFSDGELSFMKEWMVTPESLYISRPTPTIHLIQSSIYFDKPFTSMDFHPGLDLTKEVKTLEFPCLCFNIQREVQVEEV